MFKKLLSLALATIMVMMMGTTAFATEEPSPNTSTDYQEYTQLINDDILGNDITFEYWQELKVRSAQLEKELENSTEFSNVYDSTLAATYSMTAGDVFITNGTSSFGLTGHSGIAISSTQILHISGPGENPTTISLSTWNTDYTSKGWTKAYRHTDNDIAYSAATWAIDTYEGSDAEYSINMDLTSTDKTYCSKLVWQAYYYGPDSHCANGPTIGVRLPYDLPTTIHDLSLMKTYR